jgi:putative acetyltransferase
VNGVSGLSIALESPDQPEVRALIDALDALQRSLYPPASNHLLDMAALLAPNVLFAVARDAGAAVGCGAVVCKGAHGELKRMMVSPACRGRGVGTALLQRLEAEAVARGCTELRLETGIHQPEAIGLYERQGYRRGPPFDGYIDDPLSLFMCKPLAGVASGG